MLVPANIFQPLIDVFEAVIKFFHTTVGAPWGLSIVLLTLTIRAVLLPLTLKQFHSMRALQLLQPQLKEIQTKYKQDKQRQQQELMKFYKENNVNPLASCLPLVAQLPVMISLFYMLRKNLREDICPKIQKAWQTTYAAAHHITLTAAKAQTIPCVSHGYHSSAASFLFIKDLTNNATGVVLIVLIVLYVGTQLGSTLMMQTPTMDQNQRRLMMFMPLIFVLFIIRFPAGVLVYWITTNAWTMAQQYVIKRRIGPPPPVAVAVAGGGSTRGGGRSGGSSSGKGGSSGGTGGSSSGKGGSSSSKRDSGNGSGPDGDSPAPSGLGSAIRSKLKPADAPAAVGSQRSRGGTPPPPPRKKKKRSGKR